MLISVTPPDYPVLPGVVSVQHAYSSLGLLDVLLGAEIAGAACAHRRDGFGPELIAVSGERVHVYVCDLDRPKA